MNKVKIYKTFGPGTEGKRFICEDPVPAIGVGNQMIWRQVVRKWWGWKKIGAAFLDWPNMFEEVKREDL